MSETVTNLLNIQAGEVSCEVSSLVDAGMEIKGEVTNNTERPVLISGTVIGTVVSKGPVIINEGAEVRGSITASALQISGTVKGQTPQDRLVIAGPVVLRKTAHLGCDVECDGIQTEMGATMDAAVRPRKKESIQKPVAANQNMISVLPTDEPPRYLRLPDSPSPEQQAAHLP